MIVFVEFFVNGKSAGFYWMDHSNEEHRKCLGHRCAIAFAEGTAVFTASVQKVGHFPTHRFS